MSDEELRAAYREELRVLRAQRTAREAELEAHISLGHALTPATGPGGRLTEADIRRIAADAAEYELRRTEIHEALAGYPGRLPIDPATGQTIAITRAVLRSLTQEQIAANRPAIDAALAAGKDPS